MSKKRAVVVGVSASVMLGLSTVVYAVDESWLATTAGGLRIGGSGDPGADLIEFADDGEIAFTGTGGIIFTEEGTVFGEDRINVMSLTDVGVGVIDPILDEVEARVELSATGDASMTSRGEAKVVCEDDGDVVIHLGS